MLERMIDPGQHLQRLSRSQRTYTDQHGRHFTACADALNQQPTEELRPVGFTVPWQPPMRYAKWQRTGDLHFRWDYERMADDLATLTAGYYEEAIKFAIEHGFPVPEVGGVVDRRVVAVFGVPPLSPEIPMAAQAGHPWLLGTPGALRDDDLAAILNQGHANTASDAKTAILERVNARMARINHPETHEADVRVVPAALAEAVTYNEFFAEARKQGLTAAEISLAWKAHKDHIAMESAA
jgi:hypothetical protein